MVDGDTTNGVAGNQVWSVRDQLREAIVRGDIAPSAVRTQAQLATELGVSRTPLREALRMLELEHLIVRQSNGRFRVAGLSLDELEQLGVMRIVLEAAAVRLTVPQLTNADHAELEGLLAQATRLAEMNEWDAFDEPHERFHSKLTGGVGPIYSDQLARLWEHSRRYRQARASIVPGHKMHEVSRREHRAILDAAEAYDAQQAAGFVAGQFARTALEIAADIDPGYAMEKVRVALEVETGSRELPEP